MKAHERMAMTPLEQAVWAAAFTSRMNAKDVKDGHLVREAIGVADFMVALARAGLEDARKREETADAKAKHQTRKTCESEHNGPGTIRSHPRESREHSLNKIGKVLSESDR